VYLIAHVHVSRLLHAWNSRSSVQESPMYTDMWCELAFKKWSQIPILVRTKGRPKFRINKVRLGYSIVMLSFGFVTVEIFECSSLRSILCFNVACLPKRLSTPDLEELKPTMKFTIERATTRTVPFGDGLRTDKRTQKADWHRVIVTQHSQPPIQQKARSSQMLREQGSSCVHRWR